MDLPIKLTDKAFIFSVDALKSDFKELTISRYRIGIGFYDSEYYADIDQTSIDSDDQYDTMLQGDSDLYDSMQNLIEQDETWTKIKQVCVEYLNEYKENYK